MRYATHMRDIESEKKAYFTKLGKLVKEARIERDLSARQVACYTGINQANLSRFERGIRGMKPENIQRLLDYLNIDSTMIDGNVEIVIRSEVFEEFKMVQCPKCLTRQKVYFPR